MFFAIFKNSNQHYYYFSTINLSHHNFIPLGIINIQLSATVIGPTSIADFAKFC
jgi:hypothetical protein